MISDEQDSLFENLIEYSSTEAPICNSIKLITESTVTN